MKVTTTGQLKNIYLTLHGLEEATNELNFLKSKKRIEIAQRLQDARELNNTEENSEFEAALAEQDMLENRISELEKIVRNAKVITDKEHEEGVVTLGSTVKVEMDGQIDEFTIVGKVEANPSQKKISNESPVGRALLGGKIGEEVEVATPIVRYICKILDIA